MLSWNINRLSGLKKKDPECVELMTKFDVKLLYETWASADSNLNLNKYCSHVFTECFSIEMSEDVVVAWLRIIENTI